MKNVLKRATLGTLGVAAVLAYWSLRGSSSSSSSEGIPSKVWAGGGATLAIEAESTSPARFSVSFTERTKPDPQMLETWAKVDAGTHSWTIDVPPSVG
jgi:hypothetical protein